MSFPLSPRARSGPRRRSLLAAAPAALLVAGCSAGTGGPGTAAARPSAEDRARERAARDSRALAERYDAVLAAHPKLAAQLRPLRADVVRHAEAFEAGAARSPSPSVSPGPSASASAVTAPSSSPSATVPVTEKDALAQLVAEERRIADLRAEELLTAPAELARLLASVSAAGAAHVYLLTEAGR
ncbi:hypothetical protein FB570_11529 [Streptomyces sp. T12]|uniref:hypothetical protein n=1 Tax=Streptomyces sp. T12 TaxID=477697 RepID=UPI0011AB0810|nr:hypothetical protein [Streptomyces sp. T12]TWD14117.1 hypothetical protein FB570_11529 [Streptomyces sp. T12]